MLNSSGAKIGEMRYTPFGETRLITGSVPTDRRYTGQRQESVGLGSLYDYGARFYSPTLGRFLSADTIVPEAGNPQDFNRYSYTRNNPVKHVDPTGHFTNEAIQHYLKLQYGYGWEEIWLNWLADDEWLGMLRATEGGDTLAFASTDQLEYYKFLGEGQDSLTGLERSEDIVGSRTRPTALSHGNWLEILRRRSSIVSRNRDRARIGVFGLEEDGMGVQRLIARYTAHDILTRQTAYVQTVSAFEEEAWKIMAQLVGVARLGVLGTFASGPVAEIQYKLGGKAGDDVLDLEVNLSNKRYVGKIVLRNGRVLSSAYQCAPGFFTGDCQ